MLGKFLNIRRNIYSVAHNLGILSRDDKLLVKKKGSTTGRAIELYRELLDDPVVFASFDKLVTEITQREVILTGSNAAVEDFVRQALDKIGRYNETTSGGKASGEITTGFAGLVRGLCQSYITGLEVAELEWRLDGDAVIVSNAYLRDNRQILLKVTESGEIEVRAVTKSTGYEGEPLPPRSFILQRYWGNNNGDPYGSGLGKVLQPLVESRKLSLADWLTFANKYANPSAIIKYPLGLPDEEVDNLLSLGQTLGESSSAVLPEGISVEWLEANGNAGLYQSFLEYLDKQIATVITGESIAGQDGEGGSRSRDSIADSLRIKKAKALADYVAETLNSTLVKWLVELNFPAKTPLPTLSFDFSDLEIGLSSDTLLKQAKDLGQLGYSIPQEILERSLGFKLVKQDTLGTTLPSLDGLGAPVDAEVQPTENTDEQQSME